MQKYFTNPQALRKPEFSLLTHLINIFNAELEEENFYQTIQINPEMQRPLSSLEKTKSEQIRSISEDLCASSFTQATTFMHLDSRGERNRKPFWQLLKVNKLSGRA